MKKFTFKKICIRCNEYFNPYGKYNKICERCTKKGGYQGVKK